VRRRALAIAGLALLALAAAALPLLRAAGRFLVENDPLRHADAIVVLAGSYPDRIIEAVTLYREGWAPRLILCREPPNAGFRKLRSLGVSVPQVFELNRSVAEQMGVPPQAIAVVDRPTTSTYGEAQVVLAEALQRGYRSLVVVTSKYHTARAGRIFRHLAGGRVAIVVRPARDDEFQPDGWWRHRLSARRVVIEYQKLFAFLFFDRWRLSPVRPAGAEPTPAGA
jgi:uncharacterized SAM-binding protein YcdF (DUF218 family)